MSQRESAWGDNVDIKGGQGTEYLDILPAEKSGTPPGCLTAGGW